MSYNPITDFLGLLRQTSSGFGQAAMPGLDYVVAAMARAGLFTLSTGQTAPTANQSSTVWLKPSNPSWVAEGAVFLWSAVAQTYVPATPALWTALLSQAGYIFQSAPASSNIVNAGVSLLAVQRAAPTSTTLILPTVGAQFLTGKPLKVVDWSTAVTNHVLALLPTGGATIMQRAAWTLLSTPDQLAGIELLASPDLNGWVVAP